MNPKIAVTNLLKEYGETTAVGPVSFDVQKGEFFSILGPSGCGKTTTLRLIAGFEDPTEGEILIDSCCVNGWPPERRQVGFVFQNYAVFPHMSVCDNVAYGLKIRHVSRADINEKVGSILELVGLGDLGNRMPDQLSSGQQQRVALARSLVVEPAVLLLDEPLSNLDLKLRLEMRSEITRLQRHVSFTAIYVTHDQGEALSMSDRVLVMRNGRIEQIGTPVEIYEQPQNEFVADFIGGCNFLIGTTSICLESGHVEMRTETGLRFLIDGLSIGTLPKHQTGRMTAVIRPEKVGVSLAQPVSDVNVFRADVEEAVYYGARLQLALRIDEHVLLRASKPVDEETRGVAKGDPVWVNVEPKDVTLLRVGG